MIVTCTSCQTRFRVPPGKIGPNGARLRCSRCRAVFVVGPEEDPVPAAGPARDTDWPEPAPQAAAGPPSPVPPSDDPFAAAAAPAGATSDDPFAAAPARQRPQLQPPTPELAMPALERSEEEPRVAELLDPRAVAPLERPGPELDLEPSPAPEPFAPELELEVAPSAASVVSAAPDRGGEWVAPTLVPAASAPAAPEGSAAPPRPAAREPAMILTGLADVTMVGAPPQEAPQVPPPAATSPAASPPRRAPTAVETTQPLQDELSHRTPRRLTSEALWLALLLVLAGTLVLGWQAGMVPRLRGQRAAAQVEVADARGGAYDTAAGRPALVVRGVVVVRERVAGPVRVRVEVGVGGGAVASAEALAGGEASPEEVFEGATPDRVEALRRTIDARAARGAPPGARLAFLVVFPAPAPEPTSIAVQASADPPAGR